MRHTWRGWLAAALTLCGAGGARAGNDDGVLVGGQAALTGGAVTAIVSDGSAAWYNPAGLATLTRAKLDISASTYGISHSTSRNLFTLPDGTRSSASVVDWQLIPTALSYARKLGAGLVGSFGVYIPNSSDTDLRTYVRQPDGSRWTFNTDQLRNDYSYIATVSGKLSDALRWGVALHGVFISNEEVLQVGIGKPGQLNTPLVVISEHTQTDDYGVRVGMGLQWDARRDLTLGAALQTPTLTGFRDTTRDQISGVSGAGSTNFESSHEAGFASVWELSTPLVARLGAAYTRGRIQWLVDGSISSPLKSGERTLDRRLSGNARAGCLVALSEQLTVGAGLFTDRNGLRSYGADFVGTALGLRYASTYHLQEGGRALTFSTTIGLRYAHGWGDTEGIAIQQATDETTLANLQITRVHLRVNEAAINLSSGVSY